MDFSNSGWVRKLRIVFMTLGLSWLLTIALFIFLDWFTVAIILAGLFLVTVLIIPLLNFQYVEIVVENNKLTVRYYSIFSVDKMFQMFEIQVDTLRKIEIRKRFLGLKREILFTVRVTRGLADYPLVSLTGIPSHERSRLIAALKNLIPQEHRF